MLRTVSRRIKGNAQLLEMRDGPATQVRCDIVLYGGQDVSRTFGPSLHAKPDWSQVLGEIQLLDVEHGDLSRYTGYILLLEQGRIECKISVALSDKLLTYKISGSITKAP